MNQLLARQNEESLRKANSLIKVIFLVKDAPEQISFHFINESVDLRLVNIIIMPNLFEVAQIEFYLAQEENDVANKDLSTYWRRVNI